MFHGEEKYDRVDNTGISVKQAEDIAINNMMWVGLGSLAVFIIIYKFLIK